MAPTQLHGEGRQAATRTLTWEGCSQSFRMPISWENESVCVGGVCTWEVRPELRGGRGEGAGQKARITSEG